MPTYFEKHLFRPVRLQEKPAGDLSLIVVIPCHNEPNVVATLNSLNDCSSCTGTVEVIIALNGAANSSGAIKSQNENSFQEIISWQANQRGRRFRLFVLRDEDLPSRHAGVGLARKIGMDEAAWRLESIGKKDGVIVCLDADCVVEPNYLSAIEKYFLNHPLAKAASIYFEHPLDISDTTLREGIINYEIHLRYYIQGLKYAGYPFACHAIGSGMCVRSNVYQRAGGMNRRKAGEDFYFLHKIIPLGGFGTINNTTVYPSPRISDRVPFGTGRAMKEWADNPAGFTTYNIRIFDDLKIFMESVSSYYKASGEEARKSTEMLPLPVRSFLESAGFLEKIEEVNAHTAGMKTFMPRWFNWMDGFRMLKMIHYMRNHFYPDMRVEEAANELLARLNDRNTRDIAGLLKLYRAMDKTG